LDAVRQRERIRRMTSTHWFEAKVSVPVPADLYHLVADEVERLAAQYPLRYCAREKCGEPFRIQDSSRRTTVRKPRTGALYCSSACARAQAQAEVRARGKGTE
jgi:hypothetical protein